MLASAALTRLGGDELRVVVHVAQGTAKHLSNHPLLHVNHHRPCLTRSAVMEDRQQSDDRYMRRAITRDESGSYNIK